MRLLIGDCETADLKGGVCDIALMQIDMDFNILWQSESLIDPEKPISPDASGIHHIVDEMVQDAPTLSEYMELNGHPLDCDDLVLIGHNIAFDARMLADHMPENYLKVCTLKLARLIWPDAANHKLQTLRYTFKLDAGNAHRAMGDVVTCYSLLKLMAQETNTDLEGLMRMSRKHIPLSSLMPFGKHKGTALSELPMSYVQWLLTSTDNLDPDLREALATR